MAINALVFLAPMLSFLIMTSRNGALSSDVCEGLTSYHLQLNTFWSKETFYRQYPTYRPHAQWSRLIGRTHSQHYSIWSEGKMASEALQEFAEQGLATAFDVEAQGNRGIFDAFNGQNVASGVGFSSTRFLAHSNYSKMSFVVRMIPSPDWFIGVDSLELCIDGEWISEKTLDLRPFDSGTDRGFSFTSPNWPEEPHQPIYAMTPSFPKHPASSFYYSEWKDLPPIANVKLTRVDLNWIDDQEDNSAVSGTPTSVTDEVKLTGQSSSDDRRASAVVVALGKSLLSKSDSADFLRSLLNDTDSQESVAKTVIRRKYGSARSSRLLRNGKVHGMKNELTGSGGGGIHVDCLVSDWSDWSECSKTCGFGIRIRTRSVIQRQLNNGKRCPLLREELLCGGVRSCTG